MKTAKELSILLLVCALILQGCSLLIEDDVDCPITSQPLTEDNLRVLNEVPFRRSVTAELYYITGKCFGNGGSTQWEYSGEAIFQSSASSINGFEFITSGTLCAQLQTEKGMSEKVCQEINVHRDHIWGKSNFPGKKTKQTVTMQLNGDVYAGFGMFNDWYKLDTTSFIWFQKASIPNLIDFNAFAGFAIDNKGYLVGNNSVLYEYDPNADTWTNKGTLPEQVSTVLNLGAFTVRGEYKYPVLGVSEGGKGYFGIGNQDYLLEYNPATNTWKELERRPTKGNVGDHCFAYQGKIYTGKYVYDIANASWAVGKYDFSVSADFSPGFVPYKGVMYGGRSNQTVFFDGKNIAKVDLGGATEAVTVSPGLYGSGAATGNFIIFPRQMGNIGGSEESFLYYIDQ